jgi:hypothetical protein
LRGFFGFAPRSVEGRPLRWNASFPQVAEANINILKDAAGEFRDSMFDSAE